MATLIFAQAVIPKKHW